VEERESTPTLGEILWRVSRLERMEGEYVTNTLFAASLTNVGDRMKDMQEDLHSIIDTQNKNKGNRWMLIVALASAFVNFGLGLVLISVKLGG
jgi:hypothetical protein